MTRVLYEIAEHDGGWAYKFKDVFSEPFPTREAALAAAERAAREQTVPGAPEDIEFQDNAGRWHHEYASGQDRPETGVVDTGGEEDERNAR